jgi:glycosyltransferase involved in cell wall biosynthesis
MHCLVISPTPSHPQNAGNRQRIHALMRHLKQCGHRVDFCFVAREQVDDAALLAMRRAWDQVTVVPHDRSREPRPQNGVFAIDDWFLPPVAEAVQYLADSATYDLVMVEYVFLSKALDFFPAGTLKLLDTHDIFADRHKRLQALGMNPGFFWTSPMEERRGLDRADLVIAIQDEERRMFEENTRASVITIGFLPETAPPAPVAHEGLRIGYLGSGNPINTRAMRRFLAALDGPGLQASDATLTIGGGAGAAMADAAGPGVEVQGTTDDLAGFYAGLDLAVNPHEGGTGLKIKTVEALAHGLPVIGTAEAFLGLDAEAACHAARDAADLAGMAQRFAAEPAFRDRAAAASATLFARYRADVERQLSVLRDRASIQARLHRPRALLITDVAFWREQLGSQVRIAELLRLARASMDIDVLAFRSLSPQEQRQTQNIVGARGRVFSFKKYPNAHPGEASWVERSGLMLPFEARCLTRDYFHATEAHLREYSYDIGIIEYCSLSYLRHATGFPRLKVLDTHDVMSLRMENFAAFGKRHHILIGKPEEMALFDSYDQLITIQSYEHRFLSRLLPGKALYIPYSTPDVPRIDASRPARRVAFVGGDSPMNRDGLRWFLEQVWPCFTGRQAVLHVAGAVGQTVAAEMGSAMPPDVQLHDVVEDLAGFLDAADIAINPVYYGGGLKIKTVEYLTRGIPSVLTEEALFGIEGGAGTAYAVARSREEYVAALDLLLTDDAARARMSEEAFAFGRAHFGRRIAQAGLDALAQFAAGAMRAPPASLAAE